MPTIQKLIPIQRSAPPPVKPPEPRPADRKDDFQQRLDEAAANKPPKSAATSAKPEKAEAKKPASKSTSSGKAKGKTEAKRVSDQVGDADVNASDEAGTEGNDGILPQTGDSASDEAQAEGEAGPKVVKAKDGDADAEHKDSATDAAAADAAALAQTTVAVKPVTAPKDEQQKGGRQGQQGTQTDGPVAAVAKGATDATAAQKPTAAARVKAVGKHETDDVTGDGTTDDTGDPTAALADAILKATGGDGKQSADEDGDLPSDASATAGAKKPVDTKAATAVGLGLQRTEVETRPQKATAAQNPAAGPLDATAAAASAAAQASAVVGQPVRDDKDTKSDAGADAGKGLTSDATAVAAGQAQGPQAGQAVHRATNLPAPQPPEVQFADANHDPIVTGVKAQLLPHGGSMQIRLDPPELGALKVMVEMRDGAMTATFQTSNEEATRLLSHSLNQLKHVLEGQGVSVERLQVQQAPKGESASSGGNNGDDAKQQQNPQNWQDEHAARQEQQRKEVLQRMWRRVAGIADPIDVTA